MLSVLIALSTNFICNMQHEYCFGFGILIIIYCAMHDIYSVSNLGVTHLIRINLQVFMIMVSEIVSVSIL